VLFSWIVSADPLIQWKIQCIIPSHVLLDESQTSSSIRSRGPQSTARGIMKRAGATPVCGRSSRHKPASLVSSLRGRSRP
jgi:hypothetical protein